MKATAVSILILILLVTGSLSSKIVRKNPAPQDTLLSSTWSDAQPSPGSLLPNQNLFTVAGAFSDTGMYFACQMVNTDPPNQVIMSTSFVSVTQGATSFTCTFPFDSSFTYNPLTETRLQIVASSAADGAEAVTVTGPTTYLYHLPPYWTNVDPAPGGYLSPGMSSLTVNGAFVQSNTFYSCRFVYANDPLVTQSTPFEGSSNENQFTCQVPVVKSSYVPGSDWQFSFLAAPSSSGGGAYILNSQISATFRFNDSWAMATPSAASVLVPSTTRVTVSGSFFPTHVYTLYFVDSQSGNLLLATGYTSPFNGAVSNLVPLQLNYQAGTQVSLQVRGSTGIGVMGELIGGPITYNYVLSGFWTAVSCELGNEVIPGVSVLLVTGSFMSSDYYSCKLSFASDNSLAIQSNYGGPKTTSQLNCLLGVPLSAYAAGAQVSLAVNESPDNTDDNSYAITHTSAYFFTLGSSWRALEPPTGSILMLSQTTVTVRGSFFTNGKMYSCTISAATFAPLSSAWVASSDGSEVTCAFPALYGYVAGTEVAVSVNQSTDAQGTKSLQLGTPATAQTYLLGAYWTASSSPNGATVVPSQTTIAVTGSFLQTKSYACRLADQTTGDTVILSPFTAPTSQTEMSCTIPLGQTYTAGSQVVLQIVQADDSSGTNQTPDILSSTKYTYVMSSYWASSIPGDNDMVNPGSTTITVSGAFAPNKFYLCSLLSSSTNDKIVQTVPTSPTDQGQTVLCTVPSTFGYDASTSAYLVVLESSTPDGANTQQVTSFPFISFNLPAYWTTSSLATGQSVDPGNTMVTISGSFFAAKNYGCLFTQLGTGATVLSTNYMPPSGSQTLVCRVSNPGKPYPAGAGVYLEVFESADMLGTQAVRTNNQSFYVFPVAASWYSSSLASGSYVYATPNTQFQTLLTISGSFYASSRYYSCVLREMSSGQLDIQTVWKTTASAVTFECILPSDAIFVAGTQVVLEVQEALEVNGTGTTTLPGSSYSYLLGATWLGASLPNRANVIPTQTYLTMYGHFAQGMYYAIQLSSYFAPQFVLYTNKTANSSMEFLIPYIETYMSGYSATLLLLQASDAAGTGKSTVVGPPTSIMYTLRDDAPPQPPRPCLRTTSTLDMEWKVLTLQWSPFTDKHGTVQGYKYSVGLGFSVDNLVPTTSLPAYTTTASIDLGKLTDLPLGNEQLAVRISAVNSDGLVGSCTDYILAGRKVTLVSNSSSVDVTATFIDYPDALLNIRVPPIVNATIRSLAYRTLSSWDIDSQKFSAVNPANNLPPSSPPMVYLGLTFVVDAVSEQGFITDMQFEAPVVFDVSYSGMNPPPTREKSMRVYMWDTTQNQWRDPSKFCGYPYQGVSTDTSTLTAHVCHFTQFAVFMDGPTPGLDMGLVIGLSVFGGLLAVFVISAVIWRRRKQRILRGERLPLRSSDSLKMAK